MDFAYRMPFCNLSLRNPHTILMNPDQKLKGHEVYGKYVCGEAWKIELMGTVLSAHVIKHSPNLMAMS